MQEHIKLLADQAQQKLISVLADEDVAMTSDIWSSAAMDSYISVTGHFIDANWILHSNLLGMLF